MLAFFDPPTRAYNVAALVASVVGCLLGFWALWIAYVQLTKTAKSAAAAAAAATRAELRMARVATLVNVHQLTGLSGEMLVCIRGEDWGGAVIRAKDLRAGLASLQSSDEGAALATAAEWAGLRADARDVQSRLGTLRTSGGSKPAVAACTGIIASLDESLHRMSGVAARVRGD